MKYKYECTEMFMYRKNMEFCKNYKQLLQNFIHKKSNISVALFKNFLSIKLEQVHEKVHSLLPLHLLPNPSLLPFQALHQP